MTIDPTQPSETKAATEPATRKTATLASGLHCLDGAAPPSDLGEALLQILALPDPVREKFADLLLPHLEALSDDQLDQRILQYARGAGLEGDSLAPPIKSARFLLRQAAAHGTEAELLAADLKQLCPTAPALQDLLIPIYQVASAALRNEIVQNALAAHGKLLSGIEWRVDTVAACDRGRNLSVPVALVTLHYQEADKTERITIQMLPEMIAQLRNVLGSLLG